MESKYGFPDERAKSPSGFWPHCANVASPEMSASTDGVKVSKVLITTDRLVGSEAVTLASACTQN